MLKYYVSFIIFLLALPAAPQESLQLLDTHFQFDNTECSISSVQTLGIEGTQNDSTQVRIKLLFSDMGLPIFRVIFLQHKFEAVTMTWPDVGTQLNERQLFTDDLIPTVRSFENQAIALQKMNTSTFELSNHNLLHSQAMIALFLAKSSISLNISALGTSWTPSVSLRGSDEAYRQMAARCFPQESTPYLELNGSRRTLADTPSNLTSTARGISTGYGLMDFMTLLQLMPVPASWDDFSDPTPVIELLTQKKGLLNSVASVTNNTDFQASSQEVGRLLQTQRNLFERLTVISATASETSSGLIIQKENEEKALRAELERIEKQITDLQTGLLSLDERQAANQTSLSPFLEPLTEFENKTSEVESKSFSLSSYKRDIEALLQTYRDQLTADFFVTDLSVDTVAAPWSIEEIDKRNEEISPQIRTYRALSLMANQMTELHSQFDKLITQSQKVSDLTSQFLSLQSEKSQLEQKITDNENEIIKMNSMPNIGDLSSIQFAILLSNSENNAPSENRSYNDEFNFHKTAFNNLAQTFQQTLQSVAGQNKWAGLICDWTKLVQAGLRPESLNCLIITDFLNEKMRNIFLATLSPQVLDSAIDIPTQPWTLDISKIDYVSQKISTDLHSLSEPFQPLLEIEQRLRMLVWRWNVQQKKVQDIAHCQSQSLNAMIEEESFSQAFYQQMFTCENNYLLELINNKDQSITQSLGLTINVAQTKNALTAAENEFIVSSTVFSDAVNAVFSSATDAVLLEEFYTGCLDLSQGINNCQSAFQKQIDFQGAFAEKMREIDLQIRSRTLLLQQELDETHQQLAVLTEKKTEFVKANGIEQLLVEKDAVTQEIFKAQHQLVALADLASVRQQSLEENFVAQMALQQEALRIVARQTLVSLQIQNIQNSWEVECASFEKTRNSLKELDQRLMALMATTTATENATAEPQAFTLLCQ